MQDVTAATYAFAIGYYHGRTVADDSYEAMIADLEGMGMEYARPFAEQGYNRGVVDWENTVGI